jgi:dTDP-4-dehydrorhamnose reductase
MKALILGGSGMLGHKLWQTCAPRFDTFVTFRRSADFYRRFGIFDESRSLGGVSAEDLNSVREVMTQLQPDVVINCIGIVKQDAAAKDSVASITVNALFPQRLAELCRTAGTRLIHLSTDCVFSGRTGNYDESVKPDADDLYGRTKLLGEVGGEGCLTIRTSMIGRELSGAQGLVEWFLGRRGERVQGFRQAIFSGLTTLALSELLANVVEQHSNLSGTWHVAAERINKLDLLSLVRDAYESDVEIEPDDSFVCDRSLNGERFSKETGITAPPWPEMIERMRADSTPYDELRRANASR